ncbi:MAG: hypothetical protein KDA89_21330, partial [Planctomycetaceae bacterium]|nr:hypothetical protein [Planctomycetaceae bacterium]
AVGGAADGEVSLEILHHGDRKTVSVRPQLETDSDLVSAAGILRGVPSLSPDFDEHFRNFDMRFGPALEIPGDMNPQDEQQLLRRLLERSRPKPNAEAATETDAAVLHRKIDELLQEVRELRDRLKSEKVE